MRNILDKRNRRGSVMVLAAASMVALIGMAAITVDIGRLYAAKGRAQNITDSSALAGGYFLDGHTTGAGTPADVAAKTNATANAQSLTSWPIYDAAADGALGVKVDTAITSVTTAADPDHPKTVKPGEAIQVDGWVQVDYGLAHIFDVLGGSHNSGRAHAISVAMLTIMTEAPPPPLLDVGISDKLEADYLEAGSYTLKVGDWSDDWLGAGNFGLIDLSANSTMNARDQIAGTDKDGVPAVRPVAIGDTVTTMPGNKVGQEQQGMKDRLAPSAYEDGQYNQWVADGYPTDARIVICPILHQTVPLNGSSTVTVVGFAAFYIDSFDYNSKTITGVFVEAVYSGDTWKILDQYNSGTPVNTGGTILTISLVS